MRETVGVGGSDNRSGGRVYGLSVHGKSYSFKGVIENRYDRN